MSEDRVCVSVRLPEGLNDRVERRLDYDDSKQEWVLQAIKRRLERQAESPETK